LDSPIVDMKDEDFYVRAGQDIYRARGFGKMLEELDAENKDGDDDENFRGIAPLYPSAPTSDIR
jgi:hypothetical protein